MPSERIEFEGHAGEPLAARLERPAGRPKAVALFAHCFTCSKDSPAARRISRRLSALGIATLRFDFTGLGGSGGDFANTHFTSNIEDLVRAADHLAATIGAPSLLIGHSLGGAAVLAAAPRIPSAKAVATIGAPEDPGHVMRNFGADIATIREKGEAEVTLGGRPFTIRRDFLDDISAAALTPALKSLKAALLILHAPRDETVGIENATGLFTAAKHPKSFVTLDDADHLLTRAADADYAAEIIAAWSARYLDLGAADADGPPEGAVRSEEIDPDGFLQTIHAHGLTFAADEPKSVGGTDLGPTPYDLVAAGLAACTSMTVRMYARRKEWPLEAISVDVSHDKVHAADCEDCGPKDRIDVFRRTIHLSGALDDDQRERLLAIADKCPVHRTLESEARIETVLS